MAEVLRGELGERRAPRGGRGAARLRGRRRGSRGPATRPRPARARGRSATSPTTSPAHPLLAARPGRARLARGLPRAARGGRAARGAAGHAATGALSPSCSSARRTSRSSGSSRPARSSRRRRWTAPSLCAVFRPPADAVRGSARFRRLVKAGFAQRRKTLGTRSAAAASRAGALSRRARPAAIDPGRRARPSPSRSGPPSTARSGTSDGFHGRPPASSARPRPSVERAPVKPCGRYPPPRGSGPLVRAVARRRLMFLARSRPGTAGTRPDRAASPDRRSDDRVVARRVRLLELERDLEDGPVEGRVDPVSSAASSTRAPFASRLGSPSSRLPAPCTPSRRDDT